MWYRSSRWFLLKVLLRIVSAPLYKVPSYTFADFKVCFHEEIANSMNKMSMDETNCNPLDIIRELTQQEPNFKTTVNYLRRFKIENEVFPSCMYVHEKRSLESLTGCALAGSAGGLFPC
jgi:hypothetical protein